jgi:hypothetical protein
VTWLLFIIAALYLYESGSGNMAPIDWNAIGQGVSNTLNSALETFANAITNFEGQPGDLNYRNNNPGNLRYAGQPGASPGPNGFAVFDTWADGMAALQRQIQLDASRNPGWTISDFVNSYAPPSDNNPNNSNYANSIAAALGVSTDTTLGQLNLWS